MSLLGLPSQITTAWVVSTTGFRPSLGRKIKVPGRSSYQSVLSEIWDWVRGRRRSQSIHLFHSYVAQFYAEVTVMLAWQKYSSKSVDTCSILALTVWVRGPRNSRRQAMVLSQGGAVNRCFMIQWTFFMVGVHLKTGYKRYSVPVGRRWRDICPCLIYMVWVTGFTNYRIAFGVFIPY